MRVKWLRLALDDLDQAVDYLAEENPIVAEQIARRIWKASDLLAEQPSLGRPGRVSGMREGAIKHAPYIVSYRVRNEVLEVLRVIHTARQWPSGLE